MAGFVERMKRFEAKQFTGGEKNFREMKKWLEAGAITHVSWIPPTHAVEDSCTGYTDERLVIAWSGKVWTLKVGVWVVFAERDYKVGMGPFETFADEDFKLIYRGAKKDD